MTAQNESTGQLFQEIIADNKGILYKISRAYCPLEEDQQDLIQEMMIQIWKALPAYKKNAAVSTWIYRICLNVAISYQRKEKVRIKRLIETDRYHPDYETNENEAVEQHLKQLNQFLDELKSIDKAIMILYLEDKPQAEIADILGITTSNVSTKIARIKEKLKTKFHNNQPE